jgi:sulfate permease, SulP family
MASPPKPSPLPPADAVIEGWRGHSTWRVRKLSRRDVVAGLCVAGLLLPEAVAYAGLAHLPVTHALVAMVVGLAVYALFGGSRFAVVAPTSSTASLSAAAAWSLSGGASAGGLDYATVLMALTLSAGAMLCLLAAARQGQLSAYVSRPVLRGFAFGLAITIVVRQLPDALGLTLPSQGQSTLQLLGYTLSHVDRWHLPSLGVAVLAAVGLVVLRRWPAWPVSLLVMLGAMAAARVLSPEGWGVQSVGALAAPSWHWQMPALSLDVWLHVVELAFGLLILVFAESWGSIRSLALAQGDRVDANRELWVLGGCNVVSALLQGMPVGAGFSASAANAASGATSKAAAACALVVVGIVMVWALPELRWLPRPVLAVAVIAALWHALNPRPLRDVWRMNRDRELVVGSVLAVLLLGVLHGMLAAIGLSLLASLRRFSQPVLHELGRLDGSDHFVVLGTHPDALTTPGVMVLRPEEPLFFASAERVVGEVSRRLHALDAAPQGVHTVVLSLEETADLDSTAAECLLELDRHLQRQGQRLLLSRVKDPVRELLTRCDPPGLGAQGRMFMSVADAVRASQR